MKKVLIYSTPSCPYCKLAKEYFTKNGVGYTDYNVAEDAEKRDEMIKKSDQMGVPVIDIEGEIVVGFDESKLSELLGISA